MTTSRKMRAFFAGAASIMLLAACTDSDYKAENPGAAADGTCGGEKVRIAKAPPSFVYFPVYVAEGAGYFESEGLVPETIEVSTGAGIVAAAVTGSVDVAMATAGEVFISSHEGAPVQAFAQIENLGTNVVVKQDVLDERGIAPDSSDEEKLAVLKGLRIAVTGSGSGTDQVVRFLANAAGLDPDKDMEIIATGGGGNSVSGFSSDRFDAVAISSPHSDTAIEQGDGAYLLNIANGDYAPLADNLYITALAATRTIDKRTEMLKCFTAALGHAQRLIADDPAKAAEVAKPFLGEISPTIYDTAFRSNIPSWPTTPAIDVDNARAALEFQNEFLKEPIDDDVLEDALNLSIVEPNQ